jgi:hypothetical protein
MQVDLHKVCGSTCIANRSASPLPHGKDTLKPTDDPVNDLRSAWTLAVEFGQDNPELFLLIYGEPPDLRRAALRGDSRRRPGRS